MVMGYTYERVQNDSMSYEKQNNKGKFLEWWVEYIQHQGLRIEFRPFMEAYNLWKSHDRTVGILGMTVPDQRRRHVVAVDSAGVIDPADGFPEHMHLSDYVMSRLPQGVVFDTEYLAIYRE